MVIGALDREIFHHRDAGIAQQAFLRVLIHSNRRAEHARPHVRDIRQLEQPLHSAVLAVGAMQHREHNVEPWNRILCGHHICARTASRRRDESLSLRMRQQRHLRTARAQCRKMRRLLGEQAERVALEKPAPVAPDANGHNLVPRRIHRRHYGQRRAQRNLMLARSPTKENAYPEFLFFRHRAPPRPRRSLIVMKPAMGFTLPQAARARRV